MSEEPRRSPAGIPVAAVHHAPADESGHDLAAPGAFPFARGIHPDMYRSRLWTMRQYAGFGTAAQTNERFRKLLDAGQTGLSVAFDLPTQMGLDSDASRSEGEVGRAGVAIDSVDDFAAVFDGIPLDAVSTSMTINATAAVLLAMYVVVAEEQGTSRDKIRGTVQNDVLKEYVARGTYIFPLEPSLRLVTDIFAFVADEQMAFNPISISGYHMREAGSTAIQEVAFTLANAIEYVDRAVARGMPIDTFAPRISFFFAAHNDLFEEVAKFRAARSLWAAIVRDRYDGNDKSCRLRFHTQTGGSTLAAQQPLNNVVRVTIQALAAVLGGTQSLHTNGYDEALALPSEEAARLALRTQQVIAYESGATQTADPLGGSYYVEHLTNAIASEARQLLDDVERRGGAARAIESGFFQNAIGRAAYADQRALETEEKVVVGVNRFAADEQRGSISAPDYSALAEHQRQHVRATRAARDSAAWQAALQRLGEGARGDAAMMPLIVDAVRARATVGEISDTLREVWGVFRPA